MREGDDGDVEGGILCLSVGEGRVLTTLLSFRVTGDALRLSSLSSPVSAPPVALSGRAASPEL